MSQKARGNEKVLKNLRYTSFRPNYCYGYLIISKAYRECVLYSVIYIIIAGLMFYIYHIPNTTLALTIVSISYFVQKFVIAVMMIEFLKRKTSMPYVISAMQTMKFPNAVAIPFIVILRYMPTFHFIRTNKVENHIKY